MARMADLAVLVWQLAPGAASGDTSVALLSMLVNGVVPWEALLEDPRQYPVKEHAAQLHGESSGPATPPRLAWHDVLDTTH
jgi:hypothetical protein